MKQFTATLTDDQYAYVKSLGRLGLSRLIQDVMDKRAWVTALSAPDSNPWWKVWK